MADIGAAAPPTVALPLQWPLVGRHEQLELFIATLDDARGHGFVIHGPAGVGKTRLADQCLALADRAGRNVARATATEGSRAVPLGALAHLLPRGIGEARSDLVTVVAEVRPVLEEQAVNGPLVLFVDDLHLLDDTSATMVGHLVDADLVFLVATVRSDAVLPTGLEALWHRARVRRIDLEDLDRAGVDTLVHLVLGDPVEANTITEIWNASEGNVLFVRELVLGALDGGRLVHRHGVWRLVGPLVTTPRLQELLASRLSALGAPALEVLDLLAVWEPTGLSTLEESVGSDQLEALDRAGVLAVRTDGRRQQVTLAHPLYGEILRARMGPLKRRRLLLEHAERIEAHGQRRREDAIRLATARLEASGSADPQLLVRAARLARYGHDFAQVERLGRAAGLDGMSPEAGLLVGEALHELGSFTEADQVLAAAEAQAAAADRRDDELVTYLAEMRSRNLMWGLLRPADALEANRGARDRLRGRPEAEELTLNEAMLLTYSGRPREALAVIEAADPGPDRRNQALRALAEVPALVAVGRSDTAAALAGRAFTEQTALPDQLAIPGPGVHLITRCYALTDSGRFGEAAALATGAYEATPATAPPDAFMWFSHQLGRCSLLTGRVDTARRWLSEALARCEETKSVGPTRLVLSLLATAHACLGDAGAAEAAVVALERLAPAPFAEAEQELGRAWARAVAGDLVGARRMLEDAAELAASTGYRGTEAWLLHDVARLGDPTSVAPRLHQLADECEGALVPAYAVHASAAAAGRPEALTASADRFEQIGALLLAAEAATEAAEALQRAGEPRRAAALRQRASVLAGSCQGARTPGLSVPAVVVPLTPREREIATLAAHGTSSKDIADQLFLSVRTVNNHLQNVYSKLGITGRRQLAARLGDAGDLTQPEDPPGPRSSSTPP